MPPYDAFTSHLRISSRFRPPNTLGQGAAIHRCNGDHPCARLLSAVGHVIAASVALRREISFRSAAL